MVAMRLLPFDPVRQPLPPLSHDFLAVAPGGLTATREF
jgi:hypothetical protein